MSTTAKRPMLAVFADQAGKLSAMVSGLGLLAIAGIICWEVFARYVLNEPTTWVTEIATYILVAVSFLGLAAAQRARAHIYVELLVDRLSSKRQQEFMVYANWIAVFFVLFCCWQTGIFVYGEYVNGTRDWGLLSTPQWIPELPILIGFVLFGFSLLGENLDAQVERTAARSWLVVLLLVGLVVGLLVCGRQLVMIQGMRLDLCCDNFADCRLEWRAHGSRCGSYDWWLGFTTLVCAHCTYSSDWRFTVLVYFGAHASGGSYCHRAWCGGCHWLIRVTSQATASDNCRTRVEQCEFLHAYSGPHVCINEYLVDAKWCDQQDV